MSGQELSVSALRFAKSPLGPPTGNNDTTPLTSIEVIENDSDGVVALTFGKSAPGGLMHSKMGAGLQNIWAAYVSEETHSNGLIESLGTISVRALIEPGQTTNIVRQLAMNGVQVTGHTDVTVSGEIQIDDLPKALAVDGVISIGQEVVDTHAGEARSQAVDSIGTDQLGAKYRIDGSGVTVGIISDSFDTSPVVSRTYADDIASGDLPEGVSILEDFVSPDSIDEGRAMAQLIHDIAPGSSIAFHSGFPGATAFIAALADLSTTAEVIVDDLSFFFEPYYQDGQIAQAVDTIGGIIPYFSSAGNNDVQSYESRFRPVNAEEATGAGGQLDDVGENLAILFGSLESFHDFDPDPNTIDLTQSVTLQPDDLATPEFDPEGFRPILQWSDSFLSATGLVGAATDLDIAVLFDQGFGREVIFDTDFSLFGFSATANIGADAVEGDLFFYNPFTVPITVELVIANASGPNPELVKYISRNVNIFDAPLDLIDLRTIDVTDSAIVEFGAPSPTSFGHPTVANALGVGASDYQQTPVFGKDPAVLEDFSSAGGIPIVIGRDGAGIAEDKRLIRQAVDIVAPNGVDTTFFPPDSLFRTDEIAANRLDPDGTGFPNFFGTSASAPNAAAIAALLLEAAPGLEPNEIYDALRDSAFPMENPYSSDEFVVDGVGSGFINPEGALKSLISVIDDIEDTQGEPVTTAGDDFVIGTNHSEIIVGAGGDDVLDGQDDNDRLIGNDGSDTLRGGAGDDILFGDQGDDRLYGGSGDDQLEGGPGLDQFYGGEGNDTFILSHLREKIVENHNEGIDTVVIAKSFDIKSLSNIENVTIVGDKRFNAFGNDADNRLIGNDEDNKIFGRDGNDELIGAGGNDVLVGGNGVDFIQGGDGADRIIGGAGANELSGGLGADTFQIGASVGVEQVLDFEIGLDRLLVLNIEKDQIKLQDFTNERGNGTRLIFEHDDTHLPLADIYNIGPDILMQHIDCTSNELI